MPRSTPAYARPAQSSSLADRPASAVPRTPLASLPDQAARSARLESAPQAASPPHLRWLIAAAARPKVHRETDPLRQPAPSFRAPAPPAQRFHPAQFLDFPARTQLPP